MSLFSYVYYREKRNAEAQEKLEVKVEDDDDESKIAGKLSQLTMLFFANKLLHLLVSSN